MHARAWQMTPPHSEGLVTSSGNQSDAEVRELLEGGQQGVPAPGHPPYQIVLNTLRAQWSYNSIVKELIARKKRNATESDGMDGPLLLKVVSKVWEIKRTPHPNGSLKSISNQHIGALLLCQADWVGQCITIAALLEQYGAGQSVENAAVIALTALTARPRGIASFQNKLRAIVDQIHLQARKDA
ncbi:hypothetical protein K439DRAFT_1622080 [Ramaria rubella]|nr:hypothetical protein K439DRAFT_1622080 [Ramaria rubella]